MVAFSMVHEPCARAAGHRIRSRRKSNIWYVLYLFVALERLLVRGTSIIDTLSECAELAGPGRRNVTREKMHGRKPMGEVGDDRLEKCGVVG